MRLANLKFRVYDNDKQKWISPKIPWIRKINPNKICEIFPAKTKDICFIQLVHETPESSLAMTLEEAEEEINNALKSTDDIQELSSALIDAAHILKLR